MKLNDIKKALYKQNPMADFWRIRKGVADYKTIINCDEQEIPKQKEVIFNIPVEDMGDADFLCEMESKYLIRWITIKEETTS